VFILDTINRVLIAEDKVPDLDDMLIARGFPR
jgi:hypothetical protein